MKPPFDGQHGKCCWCGGPLKGKQQRWCGTDCVYTYQIARGDQGRARQLLFKRDAGKCALCLQTPEERRASGGSACWDADHIVPIVEGGALAMTNLRTLCVPCHLGETRKLRYRLAKQKKEA